MTKELFVDICLKFLNIPYIWGGDDFKGYDCSGLVQELLSCLGLDPKGDQTAQALYDHFRNRSNEGPRDVGTLLFYGSSRLRISHVAIMIGENYLIEAGGGGSDTTSAERASQRNAFVRVRPFGHRVDLVSVLNIKGLPW